MASEEFRNFLRGLVDSDNGVVASLSHVATLVVNNGGGMHSSGFAGLGALRAMFRARLPQRQWHAFQ